MSKVLIVDDESEIVDFLRNFLRRKGIQVLVANSGVQALDVFNKHTPAIILMDINMPDIDGLAVLKEIRTKDRFVKIIMVTGKDDKESIREADTLGANDYIIKPLELDNLYSTIVKYLK